MRLSRRQFLGASAAGLLALPLAGCGGAAGPASRVADDTVRVAYAELQPALDPHAWSTATGPRTLAPLFDALTFIQSDGKLRPSLAIAWNQKTPTTWQFRLRVGDAKFHTGEQFTPESVRFTFERLHEAKLPLSRLAAVVERVDILDPGTVDIVTSEPDGNLPRWISAIYMLPPHYFGQAGERGFAEQPAGTGFWALDDFQAGGHLHLAVFRDSWRRAAGSDAPLLKKLLLDVVAESSARVEAVRSLEFDLATELSSDEIKPLQMTGFAAETANLGQLNAADAGWQAAAFGAPLGSGAAAYAAAANVKGVTALPNGSWWFDRVTKTTLQRIARAGGA